MRARAKIKSIDRELFRHDPLSQRLAAVEQQFELLVVRNLDCHFGDVTQLLLVRHGGNWAFGRVEHAQLDPHFVG